MNNNAKALKSGLWYTVANFVVKAMGLITTPIFTRLLTKEEFGNYSNFISWASIAVIVIGMSMGSSLISAKFDYSRRLDQYNFSLVGLVLVSTIFWVVVLNVFSTFFSDWLSIKPLYINVMLLYCFFHEVVNTFQINERFHYGYKRSVFIAILVAVSTTVVSIALVLLMTDRLTGRIFGLVIPYMVIGSVLLIYFIKHGKKIDFSVWPYILKICIPFIPHLLSLTILNSVDRIMITRICGSVDTAMYSVAYSCGHMVTILMTSMNSAFSPWLGDKLHEEKLNEIRKVSKYYILLFCILAVLMMILAPELLLILGGSQYLNAKYVMTPVAMGCICQFIYTLFVNVEQYKKKTVGMALASVAAALLNYGLNAVFIPRYGYFAAAYTTLAGYLFLLIIHMLLVRRLGYKETYSYPFISVVIVVMMIVTVCINYLYSNTIIRFVVFGLIMFGLLTIMYMRRDLLKILFNKILKRSNA